MQQLPQVASASGSPWKIAIWFYHLKHDDGTTNWATFEPEQALGDINQYFDGLFEFSICGKTDINDDEFTAMNLSTDSPEFTDPS